MPKFYPLYHFDGSDRTFCPIMSAQGGGARASYAECVVEKCEWWIPDLGCSQGQSGIGQIAIAAGQTTEALNKLNESITQAILDAGSYIGDCV